MFIATSYIFKLLFDNITFAALSHQLKSKIEKFMIRLAANTHFPFRLLCI